VVVSLLGLKGLLTNPGASLGVSIGNMELAIDYLSNIDAYEPDLTEVKTNISKKSAKRVSKKAIVKPKLSREGIINKYSLVHNSVEISDKALDNDSIIQDADDFDFSFESDTNTKTSDIPIIHNKEHTKEMIESLNNCEINKEVNNMGDEEFELNEEFEIEGLDNFDSDNDSEDNEEIGVDFDIDSMLDDDSEEDNDEIDIDMSEISLEEDDDEEEIDIDLSLLGEDDEDEEDTELSFDLDLDSMIDDDEEDEEDEEEQIKEVNSNREPEVKLVNKKDNQ